MPLANLIIVAREHFEEESTDERMGQLKFLCGRLCVTRQVLSRCKPETGPSWLLASLLTKKQSDDLSSLAASMKRIAHVLEMQVGSSPNARLGTILMQLQAEVTPARPSYTVADVLGKFGWVPRRPRDCVGCAAPLNSCVVGAVASASQDRAAR